MNSDQHVSSRFSAALARLDGDVDLLRKMASITSEDLPEVVRHTEAAIEDGNCEQAASGLHRLKGMLSTFESDSVALDIQDILDLARQGKGDQVQAAYQQHKSSMTELIDAVARLGSIEDVDDEIDTVEE